MFDLHCHILPGVDDGPASLEEALDLARFCVHDGITHVAATPHHHRHLRLLRGRGRWVPMIFVDGSDGAGNTARRSRRVRERGLCMAGLPRVLARIGKIFGVAAPEVTAGSRHRPGAAARAAIGAVAVSGLGLPVTRVAGVLGVTPMPLFRGVPRGHILLAARKLDVEELARQAHKR